MSFHYACGVVFDCRAQILGIDPGATTKQIKSAYRQLSLIHHPDKNNGNDEMFVKVAKAYEALTDETARENYEKYGNPDGPQPMQLSIGLPEWMLAAENRWIVIVMYFAVFAAVLGVIYYL